MTTFSPTFTDRLGSPRTLSRASKRRRALFEHLEPRLAPATGSISGVVFNDLNGNGAQDGNDPGIAGRTVFLDLNQDGALDNGEPSTTSASDGSYQFGGLQPGTYLVGQVLPSGWKQSAPQGSVERQVSLTAGSPYTFTFNSLASPSDQTIPAYHENGFTFNTSAQQPTQFTVFGSSNIGRYAGAPSLSAEWAPSTISLTHDDGTPFSLTSMDLSTIGSSTYNVTVSFTGTHPDGTTVQQSFSIGRQLGFHTGTFNGFTNLNSVTWNSTGFNDYHQFRNVVVSSGGASSASGVSFGSVALSGAPPVANNDAYSVNENTALTTANPLATALTMTSQQGDYIGQGKSYGFTPANGPFTASAGVNDNHVGFAFHTPNYSDWWYLDFSAPNGARLTPGTYNGAARYPFQASNQPGLSIVGDGRGSNTLTGSFLVTQAIYDVSGNVLSFAATFTQHSEGATPALTGTVTYQAANAPPAGVLANDTDPNGLPLSAQLVNGPSHGSLALNADGTFNYTPATNYYGPDSFTYVANDGQLTSSPATVGITVNHVNQPPVAANESDGATKNQPLSVAAPGVLAGASDPDPNTTLTAKLLTGPAHGTLTLNADGSFTYTPAANYLGNDSFTYAANDGALNSNAATVSLTVTGPDDPPVASNDSYLMAQNAVLKPNAPGVLANDSDPNGQPIIASVVSGPSNGTLTLNAEGSFTYTPAAGYHGIDSFTYQASDGQLGSNVATVTITVDAPPVAVAESYATNEDTTLTVAAPGVLTNDTQADGNTLRPVLASGPAHGTIQLNADGSLTYAPNLHYSGADSFQYYVTDGKLNSPAVTDTITVNYVNYPPVANNDSYSVAEDGSLTTVLAVTSLSVQSDPGDYIGGGGTYNYGAGDGSYGVSRNYDNGVSVRFVPTANPAFSWDMDFAAPNNATLTPGTYNGAVRFPFQGPGQPGLSVTYYDRGSNTLTGTFTVYQANYDAKGNVLNFDASFLMHNEGMAPALSGHIRYHTVAGQPGVLANDTDVENEPLTAQLVNGPSHGSLALNTDGTFTYTPSPLFYGTDSFTYQANDGAGLSNVATATITVTHVNHPPTAVADSYRVGENQTLNVPAQGVLANDTDPDNDPLQAVLVAGPSHGGLTLNADGTFAYTPNANFTGTDTFQYKANDGQADSNIVQDTITVDAPPVSAGGNLSVSANVSAPVTLTASDPENDPLTYTILSGPNHGTLSGTAPNLTYSPAANYDGADAFTFKTNDGTSDSNVATVTIAVVATPAITWPSPADLVYGTLLDATQLNASASFAGSAVAGTFGYSPAAGTFLNAGASQTLSVTFTPSDTVDFRPVSSSTTINVLKATPVLAWTQPADITYGAALSSTQLDATATFQGGSLAGTFAYTPGSGVVMKAGANQTLSASFTPADTADFNPAAVTTTINVLKATPTVTWPSPAAFTYGTPLGATQLKASASVPGTFAYSPVVGTVLGAGNGQTLSALFTPSDTIDYNTVPAATTINVAKAHLTVSAGNQDMGHGDAVPSLTSTLSGFVNGDTIQAVSGSAALGTTATSTSAAGTYPVTPSAGSLSAANYDFVFIPGKVTVHPKVLDVRVHWGHQSLSVVGLGRDLPFININAVEVLFSDSVTVASGNLALKSTVGGGRSYKFSGFSENAAKTDATWTLPSALGIDRLMLALDNGFGAAVDPTISVWNNKPIGFSVLPGDFNGDGSVTSLDWQGVKKDVGQVVVWADLDGNGVVNQNDVSAARNRTGTRLP